MDWYKETCYGTTKSVLRINHKLHRRSCKAAKYSAFQVSHQLKESKSGTSHTTHHTIHSHITREFEVLQNIKDNNDCLKKKKYQKFNKILCPLKEKKIKKFNKRQKHQNKCFFIPVFFNALQTLLKKCL